MKHLYIILFVLPLIGFGQGWEQTYPSHMGCSQTVSQTSDGGYITGMSVGIEWDDQEFFLLKLDQDGNEEWSSSLITGLGNCMGIDIIVEESNNGGYFGVVSGYCWYEENEEYPFNYVENSVTSIFKTDENGNILWIIQPLSLTSIHSISQTNDDNYVIIGKFDYDNDQTVDDDLRVLKIDNNGDEIWSQDFEGLLTGGISGSLEETNDGGCVFIMNVGNINLIKLDQMGNIEWESNFNEFNYDSYNNLNVDNTVDGGFIIGGKVGLSVSNDDGTYSTDLVFMKIDENGIQESIITLNYVDPNWFSFGKFQQTSDGGYIIVGQTGGVWDSNIMLIKTDENGNEEWTQMYGNNEGYWGISVQETTDGGYIFGCQKEVSHEMEYVLYIIKTDGNGNVSTIELPTPTSKRELIKTTNILGQENTIIKNQPMIEIYDDGSTEKKIVIE